MEETPMETISNLAQSVIDIFYNEDCSIDKTNYTETTMRQIQKLCKKESSDMKCFIVNNENSIDVTIKLPEQAYGETKDYFPYLALKDLEIILPKFKAISDNLIAIREQAIIEGARSTATIEGRSMSDQFVKEALEVPNCKRIELDEGNAYDEFYLAYSENNYLPNSCNNIEVVTKEVAEENDMEYLRMEDYSKEDLENYKVGEVLSDYRKLGNSEYYFRIM